MLDSHIIALLTEMKANCEKIPKVGEYNDPKRMDKAAALGYAIFAVKNLPGADCDVKGPQHGHWINAEGYHEDGVSYGRGYHRCSCCNKVSWLAMSDDFCRRCGAKMDATILNPADPSTV